MGQLTPLNTWHHYKERAFIIGFLILCASSCVLPLRRYSSSSRQMKAESDRVSRLHCQWIGGTVNKAEQVIRPQGCHQHILQCEKQTDCREKEEKRNLLIKGNFRDVSVRCNRQTLFGFWHEQSYCEKEKNVKHLGELLTITGYLMILRSDFFFLGMIIKYKSPF